jgi:ADP-ribose pyrophosphatase YjhB (NUDIX family)
VTVDEGLAKTAVDGARPIEWLSEAEYARVQASMPIACVDVLPYRSDEGTTRVGMIRRDVPTPEGWGEGWTLVGGRIGRGETIAKAIQRHVVETLGPEVLFDATVVEENRPLAIVQYFPQPDETFLYDPRQHSVSLTYRLPLGGRVTAQGEAKDFAWFDLDDVPYDHIGFGQTEIIKQGIDSLRS